MYMSDTTVRRCLARIFVFLLRVASVLIAAFTTTAEIVTVLSSLPRFDEQNEEDFLLRFRVVVI